MAIKIKSEKQSASNLMKAFQSGNETRIKKAWNDFHDSIAESVRQDFEELQNVTDANVLAQRGVRQLTTNERKFYEKMIESAKSSNPKQAFTDLLTLDGGMPETIIEDVYRDLVAEHPLLSKVQFQNVKYLTQWLLTKSKADTAVWGTINAEITKKIEASFETITLTQGKLSAYVLIAKDMLELGPNFLDNYIRTLLKESIAIGLEAGIINGKGNKGEPIGLIRNVNGSNDPTNGLPAKTKEEITSFDPQNYGALVAKLVKTENGAIRTFDKVQLICNPVDYLNKIMPASTVLTANGTYANGIFPFPTEVIQSSAVAEGEAVLCLLPEYFLGIGASRDGVIEYSDDFKFLEDIRTYKTKMFAYGTPVDNTVALYLDITELEPAYLLVKGLNTTTIEGEVTTKTAPTA